MNAGVTAHELATNKLPTEKVETGATDFEDAEAFETTAGTEMVPGQPVSPYTQQHAAQSLVRAVWIVAGLAAVGVPLTWWRGGWQSVLLLGVGAGVSASGLWEWKRLMAALMARMDAAEGRVFEEGERPSIGFAIAGFMLRLLVVGAVLYVSLRHLHGSVLALAAGLLMGVVALTIEGLRLLRSGTM